MFKLILHTRTYDIYYIVEQVDIIYNIIYLTEFKILHQATHYLSHTLQMCIDNVLHLSRPPLICQLMWPGIQ